MARPRKKAPEIEAKQGFPGRRRAKTKAEIEAVGQQCGVPTESAPARVPPAPEWLDEQGRRLWAVLGEDLAHRQVIKIGGEWQEFARYCDHTSTWLKLRDETRTPKGRLRVVYTTITATGGKRRLKNPAFDAMLQLEIRLKDYEDRYGLNPQARTTLMMRMADQGGGKPAAGDTPSAKPAETKPGSPLGILNTAKRLN